jgi:hypothetical protein
VAYTRLDAALARSIPAAGITCRVMATGDRVRTLLLRGDNVMKNGRSLEQALAAFEEARSVAASSDDAVDPRLLELIERRIESVRGMLGAST